MRFRSLVIGLFLGLALASNGLAPSTAEANPLFILGVAVAMKMLENKPKEENAYWHKLSRKKKNKYARLKVAALQKQRTQMLKNHESRTEVVQLNKKIKLWQRRADVTGGRHKKK